MHLSWVHVNKRLPEIGQRVVIHDINDNYFVSWLSGDRKWFGLTDLEAADVYKWMPLDDRGSIDRGNYY